MNALGFQCTGHKEIVTGNREGRRPYAPFTQSYTNFYTIVYLENLNNIFINFVVNRT